MGNVRKKTKIKLLEVKWQCLRLKKKNTIDGIKDKLNFAEDKISEHEDIAKETNQNEVYRRNNNLKNE